MTRINSKARHTSLFGGSVPWLMFSLLLIAGCAWVRTSVGPDGELAPQIQEEELTQLLGSTKEEVRERFGTPRFEFIGAEKTYFVYQSRASTSGFVVVLGVPWPVDDYEETHCSMLEFGKDHRVEHFEAYVPATVQAGPIWPEGPCTTPFWSSEEFATIKRTHEAEIQKRAIEEDTQPMYNYAPRSDDPHGWYCMVAQHGHAEAQYKLGTYYQRGTAGFEKSLLRAHVWFSLSQKAGYSVAAGGIRQVSGDMTPDQISEAEHLVAEWEPNPAECWMAAEGPSGPGTPYRGYRGPELPDEEIAILDWESCWSCIRSIDDRKEVSFYSSYGGVHQAMLRPGGHHFQYDFWPHGFSGPFQGVAYVKLEAGRIYEVKENICSSGWFGDCYPEEASILIQDKSSGEIIYETRKFFRRY